MMDLTREHLDAAGDWAFPARHTPEHTPGMTLRDYFAGQALAGLLVRAEWTEDVNIKNIGISCYKLADALLNARAPSRRYGNPNET